MYYYVFVFSLVKKYKLRRQVNDPGTMDMVNMISGGFRVETLWEHNR